VPIIIEIRDMIQRCVDAANGEPDVRLFTGPRGGRITTAVLRDAHTELFPTWLTRLGDGRVGVRRVIATNG
jgi:hypothetical protein